MEEVEAIAMGLPTTSSVSGEDGRVGHTGSAGGDSMGETGTENTYPVTEGVRDSFKD